MQHELRGEQSANEELLFDMLACAARTARVELDYSPTLLRSAWIEHIPFAFWLIGAMRPRSVVELGTHWGTSYFGLCRAAKEWGLDTKCHAIDTWRGDPHAGEYGEEVFESVRTINDREFGSFSTLVRSTFADAAERFPGNSVDLLHIDGFHTYEATREDFLAWRPKVSDTGLILLHDSQERTTDFGVWRLVAELAAEYPVFEFVHGHGLAVVGVGNQWPPRVRALLGLGSDSIEAATIRQLWVMQGRQFADRMQRNVARDGTEKAQRDRIAELEQTAAALEQALANQNQNFHAQLNSRDQQLTELKQQLAMQAEHAAQASGVRDKLKEEADAQLCGLRHQLAQQRELAQQSALRAEIERVNARRENATLEARLDAILSSTSWRSTRLLRTIVSGVRGTIRESRTSAAATKKHPQSANGPVRVLMVGHALDLTGAPHSQFELAAGLKRRQLVDPVMLSTADGPLKQRYESAAIETQIIEHPLANVCDERDYQRWITVTGKLFRKLQVAAVHANTLQTFWAVDAAAAAGLPAIWNVRESEAWQTYFDWLPSALRPFAYACFERAWRVVFVSDATRAAWSPLERSIAFAVIHNGLDLHAFDTRLNEFDRDQARQRIRAEHADVVIVLVGTVTERKGQLDLVRAAALLTPGLPERCKIYIIGDRPSAYSSELHRETAELRTCWKDRLHILPETEAVPVYLRAADIAVCSSRIESYPRVILEAMAAGLPIVTTPVFGIVEQVRAGENALIYQPGDESELAGALTRLINEPDTRSRMGERSRTILQELTSYDQMLEQYAALFYQACGRELPKRSMPCAAS
jgi:glycosyltransferase involved in cell wall biosynthesis